VKLLILGLKIDFFLNQENNVPMGIAAKLLVFVTIIISVNNFALYYVIKNNGIHSKIHSIGLIVFLFSLIEIVAVGIYAYIHFK
jgi:hypothetical protein